VHLGDVGFGRGSEGVGLADNGHDLCHGVLVSVWTEGGDVVAVVSRGDVVVVARVSGEEGAVIGQSWLLEHCAVECGVLRVDERGEAERASEGIKKERVCVRK